MTARISANKLAELLVTPSATRRRRIIHDQKHPADSIVARYRLAYPAVTEFLVNDHDASVLDGAVVRLRADDSGTDWAVEDRQLTADALDHFIQLANDLPKDAKYAAGPSDAAKLMIDGVAVSVRPDLILTSVRRGKRYSGALKLHFTKNEESALGRKGAEFVTVLMYEWLRQFGPANATPLHAHCLSVDVFRRATVSAPRAITRRWDEISAGCQEIAARWPQL